MTYELIKDGMVDEEVELINDLITDGKYREASLAFKWWFHSKVIESGDDVLYPEEETRLRILAEEYGRNIPSYYMNEYTVSIDNNGNTCINGIELNDRIRNEELYEYQVRDRETLIEDLCMWILGATKDKGIMLLDLKYLMSLNDEYIFSSISTNEYIAESDNLKYFNLICWELLKLNNKINKEEKLEE